MKENKLVVLNITTTAGNDWGLRLQRKYAESLIRKFDSKLFKCGSMLIGNLDKGERVQVFNIKYITTMNIKVSDALSEGDKQ